MKKLKLTVIIVSYNTQKLLKNCLSSLFKVSRKKDLISFEVIVVDNNSQDESVAMIKKEFPQVHLITNNSNLGFSKANNQGIRIAKGEMILLLNSDTIVSPLALTNMVSFLEKHPKIAVLGCKLLNPDGTIQPSVGYFPTLWISTLMLFKEHFFSSPKVRGSFDKIKQVDWVMGAALMVRKEILNKVGQLDENMFMYMEEIELCYRIKKVGFEVVFYPYSKITHFGRGSSKTGKKEPILNIYKGLIYFYKKHRSMLELIILRILLKTKALLAYLIGVIKQDQYLKETYAEAWQIS